MQQLNACGDASAALFPPDPSSPHPNPTHATAARPSYPPAAIAHCIDRLGLQPGAKILDLAAGTGKLTRQLLDLDRFVISAAEPNAGMCEGFARTCPGVAIAQAPADELPFGDGAFDAVFVGQAYHCELLLGWFGVGAGVGVEWVKYLTSVDCRL